MSAATISEVITADFWGQSVTVANYPWKPGLDTVTETDIGGGVIERHEQSHEGDFFVAGIAVIYFWRRWRSDPVHVQALPARRFESRTMNTKAHGPVYPGENEDLTKSRQLPMAPDLSMQGPKTYPDRMDQPGYRHSWDHGAVDGDGIQNEVYPPETGGANWKFKVTYNHGEWVRGPWNTTGGYWTPGVPGLGYGTISDVQGALRLPVRALLNGDPVQPRQRLSHHSV